MYTKISLSARYLMFFTPLHVSTACHQVVDPEQFYRDCVYDVCACQVKLSDCLCPAVSAYAKECAHKAVLVDWIPDVRECGKCFSFVTDVPEPSRPSRTEPNGVERSRTLPVRKRFALDLRS